ncbi:hypothetical protein [Thiothrix unzii]|uniref:Uncharacterized protein n=1 Tax=Thiothrix unzii TaxID=111769 RepID=A0A975IIH6_9GAMM|nr:hypothetical protein [Thiothrix unzii]QTR54784.1 hypothetical protein J9260_06755 [Thiothrix unzii]
MNKKLLVLSLAAILAAPAAFAAYDANSDLNNGANDDAVDKQTVNIIVPEVALLQVTDADVALTMPVPANAGDGFKTADAQTSTPQALKISSNSEAGSSAARKLTASIATELPTNWKLTITPITSAGTPVASDLVDAIKSVDIVTGILNKKDASGTFTYTLGPKADGDMMAFSGAADVAKAVVITYTLSDV